MSEAQYTELGWILAMILKVPLDPPRKTGNRVFTATRWYWKISNTKAAQHIQSMFAIKRQRQECSHYLGDNCES